jgi:hypothetical protein
VTGRAAAAVAGSRLPAAARAPRMSAQCPAGARPPSPWPSGALDSSGVPSDAATFSWISTRASARSAHLCQRAVSRSSSAICLSRGSGITGVGPRFFAGPTRSPRSRAARQVASWEEYRPSRRSSPPIAPGVLHRSASWTIFRLYSRVNRRRVAFATTSISGPPRARSTVLIDLRSLLAPDSKLPGGHCLTHIGRERWVAKRRRARRSRSRVAKKLSHRRCRRRRPTNHRARPRETGSRPRGGWT